MSQPTDPMSFECFRDSAKKGADNVAAAQQALTVVSRLVFAVLLVIISVPASMVTVFLRHRQGLCTVAIHAPLGMLLLGLPLTNPSGHVTGLLLPIWYLLLFGRSVLELGRGLYRLLAPAKTEHIHRYSLGEPMPRLHRLWQRMLGTKARCGVAVALLGEAPLLLLLAVICFIVDGVFSWGRGVSTTGALLAAAGLSVAGQCAVAVIRGAYRRQLLLDRELDQRELAASLEAGSAGFDEREPEGFVPIPR
jgi:hypothetical protein